MIEMYIPMDIPFKMDNLQGSDTRQRSSMTLPSPASTPPRQKKTACFLCVEEVGFRVWEYYFE